MVRNHASCYDVSTPSVTISMSSKLAIDKISSAIGRASSGALTNERGFVGDTAIVEVAQDKRTHGRVHKAISKRFTLGVRQCVRQGFCTAQRQLCPRA